MFDSIQRFGLTTWLLAKEWRKSFTAKVNLQIDTEPFILKTASDVGELKQALQLRHKVFIEELRGQKFRLGLDIEPLDFNCDHLIIIDRKTSEIIGTYRVLCSRFHKKFYSDQEFDLSNFRQLPGVKMELGRACVAPNYRSSARLISLLWKGIAQYMESVDARYLMGCSSVQTTSPSEIQGLIQYFRMSGAVDNDFDIQPKLGFQPEEYGVDRFRRATLPPNYRLPPLLHAYIKAGAKVAPYPAYDETFGCIDFFTVLDRECLKPAFQRRFGT